MSFLSSIRKAWSKSEGTAVCLPPSRAVVVEAVEAVAPKPAAPPVRRTPNFRKRMILVVSRNPSVRHNIEAHLTRNSEKWGVLPIDCSRAQEFLAGSKVQGVIYEPECNDGLGLDGFNELRRKYPSIVPFVRHPPSAKPSAVALGPIPPTLISTDMDWDAVDEIITRTFVIEELIGNGAVRPLLFQLRILPAFPEVYNQVVEELRNPLCSMDQVGDLISLDPLMAAKVLQVVNSAFFGLSQPVVSPREAVMILGSQRTSALVLAAHVFSGFNSNPCRGFDPVAEWRHAMAVGCAARRLANAETRDDKLADAAFTAGLLHDVGKFLLAANFADRYSQAVQRAESTGCGLRPAEREVFGTEHPLLGASLLGIWGLPLPIVQAVGWHHLPSRSGSETFNATTAVHIANLVLRAESSPEWAKETLDEAHLEAIGKKDAMEKWAEICRQQPS